MAERLTKLEREDLRARAAGGWSTAPALLKALDEIDELERELTLYREQAILATEDAVRRSSPFHEALDDDDLAVMREDSTPEGDEPR